MVIQQTPVSLYVGYVLSFYALLIFAYTCSASVSESERKLERECTLAVNTKDCLLERFPDVIVNLILSYNTPLWDVVISDIPQDEEILVRIRRVQDKGLDAIDFERCSEDDPQGGLYRIPLYCDLEDQQKLPYQGPLVPYHHWEFGADGDAWTPKRDDLPWLSQWNFKRVNNSVIAISPQKKRRVLWVGTSREYGEPSESRYEFYLTVNAASKTTAHIFVYERRSTNVRYGYAGAYKHSVGRIILANDTMRSSPVISCVRAITGIFDVITQEFSTEKTTVGECLKDTQFRLYPCHSNFTKETSTVLHTAPLYSTERNLPLYNNEYFIFYDPPLKHSSPVYHQHKDRKFCTAYVCYIKGDPSTLQKLYETENVRGSRNVSWKECSLFPAQAPSDVVTSGYY